MKNLIKFGSLIALFTLLASAQSFADDRTSCKGQGGGHCIPKKDDPDSCKNKKDATQTGKKASESATR